MLMIIFSFFVLSSLATATHPLQDVVAKSRILPHPSEVKIMSGTFPANPSYLIAQFDYNVLITGTCDTNPPAYNSYVLNTCLVVKSSSSSRIITCDGDVATITTFQGTDCKTQSSVTQMTPGCQFGESVHICGASSPYDYGEGDFLVLSTYNTSTCTNLLSATGLRSGICFNEDYGSSMIVGLTEYKYSKSGCTGKYTTTTYSTQCQMQSETDQYGSYSAISSSSSGDDSGLSGGAIAGIVIAVLIVVAAVIAGVVYYIRKPSNSHTPVTTSDTTQVGNQMIGNWSVNL